MIKRASDLRSVLVNMVRELDQGELSPRIAQQRLITTAKNIRGRAMDCYLVDALYDDLRAYVKENEREFERTPVTPAYSASLPPVDFDKYLRSLGRMENALNGSMYAFEQEIKECLKNGSCKDETAKSARRVCADFTAVMQDALDHLSLDEAPLRQWLVATTKYDPNLERSSIRFKGENDRIVAWVNKWFDVYDDNMQLLSGVGVAELAVLKPVS